MQLIHEGTLEDGTEYIEYWSPEWLRKQGEPKFWVIEKKVHFKGSVIFKDARKLYGGIWSYPASPRINNELLEQAMAEKERTEMAQKERLKANRKELEAAKERSRERRLNMPWAAPTEFEGVYQLTGLTGLWRLIKTDEKGEVTAILFRKPTNEERRRLTTSKIQSILRGREHRFIRVTEAEFEQFLV